ncbi:hypothetical protein ACP70R_022838 [Stipagrostis hirtigluma subsp. patula]
MPRPSSPRRDLRRRASPGRDPRTELPQLRSPPPSSSALGIPSGQAPRDRDPQRPSSSALEAEFSAVEVVESLRLRPPSSRSGAGDGAGVPVNAVPAAILAVNVPLSPRRLSPRHRTLASDADAIEPAGEDGP